jgi:HEPN domain-containing protein
MKSDKNYSLWIDDAEQDLLLAKMARKEKRLNHRKACFLYQQASEKALKALMLFLGIEFPYTHDIRLLLNTIEGKGYKIPDDVKAAAQLTYYAVKTRYISDYEEISNKDVKEFKITKTTLKFVKKVTKDKNLLLK